MSSSTTQHQNDAVLLTLDIGTSSTRAALYNVSDGAPYANIEHAITHEPDTTSDGGSTLDPEAIVREAVACMTAVLQKAANVEVKGVAVSTFWHSTIGVGSNGKPITPVLLWSDTRSAPQVARLHAEKDAKSYTERTGCPLHTSYLPGRLLHLAETEPEKFADCTHFLSPGEYLFSRLFGMEQVTCSFSMASASGLFDQQAQTWDEETLSWIPGMSKGRLSVVSDDTVRGLLPEWRDSLSRLSNIPFLPALGDGACSNVGSGVTDSGRLALMIGTSGAMRVMVSGGKPPPVPPGLWRYQLARNTFLLGGALTNGGSVWSWLKDTLQLPHVSVAMLQQQIAALPPDGSGLTVLPFFSGERAPLWRDDLRAIIYGLSAATTPLEIVRAHLEAVAIRFAILRDALKAVAPSVEIIGTGAGLLSSLAWAQIIADALGEPIHLSSERQASARGAALVMRERLGYGAIVDAPSVEITNTVSPNAEATEIYRKLRTRHERLLDRLLDFDRA